jgi:hypothetical protein
MIPIRMSIGASLQTVSVATNNSSTSQLGHTTPDARIVDASLR